MAKELGNFDISKLFNEDDMMAIPGHCSGECFRLDLEYFRGMDCATVRASDGNNIERDGK